MLLTLAQFPAVTPRSILGVPPNGNLQFSSLAGGQLPAQYLPIHHHRFFIDVSHQIGKKTMRNQSATLSAQAKPAAPSKAAGRPGAAQTSFQSQLPKQQALSEEAIRLRAYQKWEAAGRPISDGLRFWFEAERELSHDK